MIRPASEIGAGLAPARAARSIIPGERIHVVGVAGAGASAAALLAAGVGAAVTGCDPGAPSPYTAALDVAGLDVAPGHDAAHVVNAGGPRIDRLAVSKALTAVAPDHPELAAARASGVPLEGWQQVIADAAATAGQALVAVAGTHGKSTTTAWLLHVLAAAGLDPSGFVGALMAPEVPGRPPATARVGSGEVCVVEADEYAGNFDAYRPRLAVLLNAEWDHPDVFADAAAVESAFAEWLRSAIDGSAGPATAVVNVADPGAHRVAAALRGWPGQVVRVALEDGPNEIDPEATEALDLRARLHDEAGAPARLRLEGPLIGTVEVALPLPGRHNAANAVVVAAAAAELGVSAEAIAAGLASFPGIARRLERKGEPMGVLVLDDYGHHPSAIRATMATVRHEHPGRPLWVVYEPLTFHRTAAMLDGFAAVLAEADRAVIADVWAGRDPDQTIVSARDLASAVSARSDQPTLAPGSPEATADVLAGLVRPGDVVLVMGGGRSYVIAERLVERLASGQSG